MGARLRRALGQPIVAGDDPDLLGRVLLAPDVDLGSRVVPDEDRAETDLAEIPNLVGDLLSSGKTLGPGECFSYKVPPVLGGEIDPDNFDSRTCQCISVSWVRFTNR